MLRSIARQGGVVTLLSLVLVLALAMPAMMAPRTIEAQGSEVYALVQIPDDEGEMSLKASVEILFDARGGYGVVGCSQAQLDDLQAGGFVVVEQCSGEEDECVPQLIATMESLVPVVKSSAPPPTQGGPDDFGCKFVTDNFTEGGPTFNWIDITAKGTNTGIDCDDCGVTVPIGFSFCFYGNSYTDVAVSSNGYLTFAEDPWDWGHPGNDCPIPDPEDPEPPNDAIYPFWDDLDPRYDHGNIFYDTRGRAPNRMFIVQWDCISHYDYTRDDCYSFQVILYEGSNDILFQYRYMTDNDTSVCGDGREATVGIENADGTDGLQYSCNTPAISDGMAILFQCPGCPKKKAEVKPPSPPLPEPRVSPSWAKPLNPASLSNHILNVNPQQTSAGQPVTITTNVVNTGDEAGNMNIVLKINGQAEESRMVSVGPQGTQPVKFTVTKSQPGTYAVDIGGQKGSFVVNGAGGTTGKPLSGGMIAIIAIGIIVIASLLVLIARRRTA